jgi:hypothetical protein
MLRSAVRMLQAEYGLRLFIAVLTCFGIAGSSKSLSQPSLSADEWRWVEEACPRYLGPSLWRDCVARESAAFVNHGALTLAVKELPPAARHWIGETCTRDLGPSLLTSCVQRELEALRRPGWPTLSHLSPEHRSWVLQTCPRHFGPSLWRGCVTRELRALDPSAASPPASPPGSAERPHTPPPVVREGPTRPTAQETTRLPAWSGERPAMPTLYAKQELSAQDIFRAVSPSVYLVVAARSNEVLKDGKGSLGSAVAISSDQALTNCHVIEDHSVIALIGGDEALKAVVSRAHKESDRCYLKVEGKLRPIASVRRIKELSVGERVYTIGNPSGLTKTLGEGIISGLRVKDGISLVQTTAQISKGSSGGALVDSRGALIGITTFLLRDAQNLNFAVAAEEYWR